MKTDPDPKASSTPTEAPSRSLVRAAVLEQLRRFSQALGADFRVSRLGVFGSVARDVPVLLQTVRRMIDDLAGSDPEGEPPAAGA